MTGGQKSLLTLGQLESVALFSVEICPSLVTKRLPPKVVIYTQESSGRSFMKKDADRRN